MPRKSIKRAKRLARQVTAVAVKKAVGQMAREAGVPRRLRKRARRAVGRAIGQRRRGDKRQSESSMVAAPSALGATTRQGYGSLGEHRVVNEEPLGTIYGSVAFACNDFRVNAADAYTFPWLSKLAVNYEMYRINSLEVCSYPMVATSATGATYMSFSYDSTVQTITSGGDLESTSGCMTNPSWQTSAVTYAPPSYNRLKDFFTAAVVPDDGALIRQTDAATFHLGTEGQAGTTALCKLRVRYDITLLKPVIGSVGGAAHGVSAFVGVNTDNVSDVHSLPALEGLRTAAFEPTGEADQGYRCLIPGTYLIMARIDCTSYAPDGDHPLGGLILSRVADPDVGVGSPFARPYNLRSNNWVSGVGCYAVVTAAVNDVFTLFAYPNKDTLTYSDVHVAVLPVDSSFAF